MIHDSNTILSPLKNRVRAAICGAGGFGRTRRRQMASTGCFDLLGALEPDDDAFEAACEEEGKRLRRYGSIEEIAADPQIEAVFISSPPEFHLTQALLAAQSGKAIFTEKPLGHNWERARELVSYCLSHDIPHGHGLEVRFSPLWQHVKHLLDCNTIGRVISVSVASMHSGGLFFSPCDWRNKPEVNPGGPLFQCGIHKIDLMHFLFGPGRWEAGRVYSHVTQSPVDDGYVLLGEFASIPVTFHSHYVCSYRHAVEIYGMHGGLFCTESPTSLHLKRTDPESGQESLSDITAETLPGNRRGESLADFAAAVRERRQPAMMNGELALKALEMVFEAVSISKPQDAPA